MLLSIPGGCHKTSFRKLLTIDISFLINHDFCLWFKVHDLQKYKGLSFPNDHITMYYRKMVSYIDNDALLIHCFIEGLFGACMDWYMGLERSKIWSLKDLSYAFLKQYKYNLDMAQTANRKSSPKK